MTDLLYILLVGVAFIAGWFTARKGYNRQFEAWRATCYEAMAEAVEGNGCSAISVQQLRVMAKNLRAEMEKAK